MEAGPPCPFTLAFGGLLLFASSPLALPMSGMEHTAHVLLSLLVLVGLVEAFETGRAGATLGAAIAAAPLVRFEGLAISGAAILALLAAGRPKAALVPLAVLAGSLLAFAAYMTSNGLPVLPSLVLVKSDLSSMAVGGAPSLGILAQVLRHVHGSLGSERGLLLGLLLCAIVAAVARDWPSRPAPATLAVAAVAAVGTAAHLAAGRYGWFYRYEVYAVAFASFAVLYLWRDLIRSVWARRNLPAFLALAAAAFLVVRPYLVATLLTPAASNNIYQQQYQLHRLAADLYGGPVAVNDLGWPSYRNDGYVLDLCGLGSEEVRRRWVSGTMTAEVLAGLAASRDVGLAMVYEAWLGRSIPPGWRRVAALSIGGGLVTLASRTVSVFVTREASLPRAREALGALARSLPPGASLELDPAPAAEPPANTRGLCASGAAGPTR